MNESRVNVGVKKLPMHLQSSQNRLLIKGGKIVNDDRMFIADIYVEDGIIRQVGTQLITPGGVRVIDATGKLIIPGGIDTNTCLERYVMGTRSSEDFYSGTKAALAGGTTTIIDCVYPQAGLSLLEVYDKYRQLADSKACCDYGLHVFLPYFDSKISKEMEILVKEKQINTFRVSLSHKDGLVLQDSELFEIFGRCRELGAVAQVLAVNSNLGKILENTLYNRGITGPEGLLYAYPEVAEIEATNRTIAIADAVTCPLYFLQVVSPGAAKSIYEARLNGKVVTGETIAAALGTDGRHYMNASWRHAAGYTIIPPLRNDPLVSEKMMHYLSNGTLECSGSGHCVFNAEQKALGKDDFRLIPLGVNGVEDRLSVIWEKGVMTGIMDPYKFVATTSTNAAKMFNLYPRKGRIDVGSDADLVIWDGDATRTISKDTHHQNVDFNIFEGMVCHGVPLVVITAGRVVLEDETLRVTQGVGRFLPTAPFSPYIYKKVEQLLATTPIKPIERKPYTGPISDSFTNQSPDIFHKNGVQQHVGLDSDSPRQYPLTSSGGRSMQESSFSLSGAQCDDNRPLRTAIRTKQPPGGKSSNIW